MLLLCACVMNNTFTFTMQQSEHEGLFMYWLCWYVHCVVECEWIVRLLYQTSEGCNKHDCDLCACRGGICVQLSSCCADNVIKHVHMFMIQQWVCWSIPSVVSWFNMLCECTGMWLTHMLCVHCETMAHTCVWHDFVSLCLPNICVCYGTTHNCPVLVSDVAHTNNEAVHIHNINRYVSNNRQTVLSRIDSET